MENLTLDKELFSFWKKNKELISQLKSLMDEKEILKKQGRALNEELLKRNKIIENLEKDLSYVKQPLEEENISFSILKKLMDKLKIDLFSLLNTQYPAILVFTFLKENSQLKSFKDSRSLAEFSIDYGLINNPFFLKRVSRTSRGKTKKSYTTLLFSLLGVFELLFLIDKKKNNDEEFLETYYLLSHKKNRKELISALKSKDFVPYDLKTKKFKP